MGKQGSKQGNSQMENIAALIKEYQDEEDSMKVVFTKEELSKYKPKTPNQKKLKELYKKGLSLMCDGVAGVGKTYSVLNLAFEDVLDESTPYEKVIIVRSAVATRDIGFLPGTEEQKMEVLEKPYEGICHELFFKDVKSPYKALKHNGYLDFMSTSFIRGITVKKAIVIVDECQNLNYHELKSVITRIGEDAKIFFCGDYAQSDLLKSKNDQTGIIKFRNVLERMKSTDVVTFDKDDIVRGGLVSEFYIAEIEHEDEIIETKKQEKISRKKGLN